MKRRKFLGALGIGAVTPILPKTEKEIPKVPRQIIPGVNGSKRKLRKLSSHGISGDDILMGNEEIW